MVMKKLWLKFIFPEYKKFDNVNDAYSNFIQMEVNDKVEPKVKESKGILKNGLIVRFQKN